MYGFTTSDINEARYKAFIRMRGGDEKYPLATIKKSNCACLPPCNKTLGNHVIRAQFVSMYGGEPIRRIQLVRQDPPTTDGKKTITAWSQTGFEEGLSHSEPLVETMPQPAWMKPHLTSDDDTNRTDNPHDDVDDMEMVEPTSTDDEFESAWRQDSDDSAEEDP